MSFSQRRRTIHRISATDKFRGGLAYNGHWICYLLVIAAVPRPQPMAVLR
jgi:hypothetical protein